jgi:hypothetical protein
MVAQLAEAFVTVALVKRTSLEAERVEKGATASSRRRFFLGRTKQARAVTLVAKPLGDPKMPDVKPRAPRVADQSARNGVIGVSQKDRDGTIIRYDRSRHVEFIQPRFNPGDIS